MTVRTPENLLGCAFKTAVVVLAAVLLAVAAALWMDASGGGGTESAACTEENAVHILHVSARGIRWAVMGVLMALTAYIAFCNHALMWSNSRKKTSRSLIPILGPVFGTAAFLAAPAGSVWRWGAAVLTLADPGTWLTFWLIWDLLRHPEFYGFERFRCKVRGPRKPPPANEESNRP